MVNYPVGDFLIRVKNIAMAGKKELEFPATKLVVNVANVLKKTGYFDSVSATKGMLNVSLTFKHKKPLILDVKLISKPGLRVYKSLDEIKVKKGATTLIMSTPKGVISNKEAIKLGTGGEIIAEIL